MALPKLDTPTYELKLPSTGQKVKFRPFLVKEHKVLLSMSEADNDEVARIIRELVDVCTFNILDVNKLPYFDIEYIFMNLRSKSIGEAVDVILNCECGNKIETSFSIEDLKVQSTPDHSNKIKITENVGIEMNYPTIDEIVKVFDSKESQQVLDLIIDNIKSVYTKDDFWDAKEQDKKELEEFVYSLTKEQFDSIETFFKTAPKIVQTIEADCNNCGKHNKSELVGLQNFFV